MVNNDLGGNQDILLADGAGSTLDFSSATAIDTPANFGGIGGNTYTIHAINGGVIDFSNVLTVAGAGAGGDWLRFAMDMGPDMDLSSVEQISRRVWIDLSIGTVFDLPAVQAISSSLIRVPVFARLTAPLLTSLSFTTLDISTGGTFVSPTLTNIRGSALTLSPGRFLIAPPFTNIDNARITINGGATLHVAAPAYRVDADLGGNQNVLAVDGSGSLLDLSSVNSIAITTGIGGIGGTTYTVSATNGGNLDLSGLTDVTGGLSQGIFGGSDWLRFLTTSGGHTFFGNLVTTANQSIIQVDGSTSRLTFASLFLNDTPAELIVTTQGTVEIRGDYIFRHMNESRINTGGGVFEMTGQATQRMEVGSMDTGIPSATVTSNFEIGQLIIGQTSQATTVQLVDVFDNGNRGPMGEPEALYIQGFPQGLGGLRILGGSTLVIGNLNVYATDANQTWFRVNDMFPVGVNTIPFEGGFIALTPDCNSNLIPDDQDIFNGTSVDCDLNGVPDECEPDCNVNGIVDACDVNPTDPDGNGLVSTDCDLNVIPDECEPDCNVNGVVDACDVDPLDPDGNGLISPDCDGNGVPDECDPDCNTNGTPDACEVGFPDCNINGVPDTCELVGNDCNANSIPDDCDTDCNNNMIPDDCDVAVLDCNTDGIPDDCQLTSNDCNVDLIPDDCQLAANDCNTNGVPDECEPDCNVNGIPDQCDITGGTSQDCNSNGLPDECDISSSFSQDCDLNGIPDECGPTTQYVLDDGTGDVLVCISQDADQIWLNQFTVNAGAETIVTVDIAWGRVDVGQPTMTALACVRIFRLSPSAHV